ncbi:acylphosphatase [Solicola gregarius]|uniref:acylphosphatase n=1 Tax=Solicola gregarius TaxID=2908642 RepID=A0AA46TFK2_9ACTN|nr:acylphosphatase [Solicola gregarius]UYM04191.1 acylphosphatase [Solicola gregarius]
MTPIHDDATVARRVVVHGRVQGVFFRDTCRREATRLGVAGYIRNEPDGTVSAEFEGAPVAVDAMIAWMRQGPRHAVVDRADVEEISPSGREGFRVA